MYVTPGSRPLRTVVDQPVVQEVTAGPSFHRPVGVGLARELRIEKRPRDGVKLSFVCAPCVTPS
jgi:hypothetical protein